MLRRRRSVERRRRAGSKAPGRGAPTPAPAPAPVCREASEIGPDTVIRAEPRLAASSFPYRPDTVVDGGVVYGLTVRAASVRGRSKRFHGRPREDDFCLGASDAREALIVAVADGLGSASRAALGAALAVRHAVEEIESQLAHAEPQELRLDWRQVFNRAASALVLEHRRQNGVDGDEPPQEEESRAVSRDLGSTLTVAVVQARQGGGAIVRAAATGDSPIYLLQGADYRHLAGSRQSDGEFASSSVIALPYLPEPETCETEMAASDVLLICTDGFSEPLGDGRGEVGRLFAAELRSPPPLVSWSYLVDFAKASYDDDRTLVAVWPSHGGGQSVR
jgi:serine/threonine protein phosphatase PrpC